MQDRILQNLAGALPSRDLPCGWPVQGLCSRCTSAILPESTVWTGLNKTALSRCGVRRKNGFEKKFFCQTTLLAALLRGAPGVWFGGPCLRAGG